MIGSLEKKFYFLCSLSLLAGFILGLCLSEIKKVFTRSWSDNTEVLVQRFVDELGLDDSQREALRTVIEGNKEKIRAFKESEENLNPWARKKIAEIRKEIDYIIQNEILNNEMQLKRYWELRGKGGK